MTAYSLRKGMATLLRQRGLSPWDVQGMLGHRATGGVTEGYAQWDGPASTRVAGVVEGIIAEVRPYWLDSSPTVAGSEPEAEASKMLIAVGFSGGRDRDRTCDPFHVKAAGLPGFQGLTVANDDSGGQ